MGLFTPISWPVDTEVYLCNVPWDAQYRSIVKFDDEQSRDDYFRSLGNSHSIRLDKLTYLKPNEPILVDIPYSACYNYNYICVENPELPVPGEVTPPKLYYFVSNVAYIAPNTTALDVQLDVWTTYQFAIRWGRCYVERGHVAFASLYQAIENATGHPVNAPEDFDPVEISHYCTVAEGLDIGSEYRIGSHDYFDISGAGEGEKGFRVIVMSTTDLVADWGTVNNPSLKTADGQKVDGLIGGCNVYSLTSDNFKLFMTSIAGAPWVAKGILAIMAFPSKFLSDGPSVDIGGVEANFLGTTDDAGIYWESDNLYSKMKEGLPERYQMLAKLYTFPYSVIELTNRQGSPLLLKPELFTAPGIGLRCQSCAVPGFIRVCFFPHKYGPQHANIAEIPYQYKNMDTGGATSVDGGYMQDCALWFDDLPQFSLVTDGYLSYLASTANTRQANYQAAGWQQARSNASAQRTYDQQIATAENDLANYYSSPQGAAAGVIDAGYRALVNAQLPFIGGSISSIASSFGAQGVNASPTQSGNFAGWGVQDLAANLTGLTPQKNNYQLSQQQAGANLSLAKWAAQGDYENTIRQINATVQDAALTQPGTVGQMGGNGFALSNGMYGVEVRYKVMDYNHVSVIGEYWMRYGYAVQRFMVPPSELCCMSKFTYWKMLETNISLSICDEQTRDVVRGIFEKGTTVWRNPNDINSTDVADNAVVPRLYY